MKIYYLAGTSVDLSGTLPTSTANAYIAANNENEAMTIIAAQCLDFHKAIPETINFENNVLTYTFEDSYLSENPIHVQVTLTVIKVI